METGVKEVKGEGEKEEEEEREEGSAQHEVGTRVGTKGCSVPRTGVSRNRKGRLGEGKLAGVVKVGLPTQEAVPVAAG